MFAGSDLFNFLLRETFVLDTAWHIIGTSQLFFERVSDGELQNKREVLLLAILTKKVP